MSDALKGSDLVKVKVLEVERQGRMAVHQGRGGWLMADGRAIGRAPSFVVSTRKGAPRVAFPLSEPQFAAAPMQVCHLLHGSSFEIQGYPQMQKFNAHEVLSKFVPAELTRIADQLNATGFVTDEDGLGLGSMLIEHWTCDCTVLIRGFGYNGGELAVSGSFFDSVGAIYVLYDDASRTGEDVAEHLERVAKMQSSMNSSWDAELRVGRDSCKNGPKVS